MRDVQRIAIVDPSDATREPLRNLLLGVDSVWLESECARYEFFFDVIAQSPPDVAIVCLDADQNKAVQLIAQVTSEYPDMPILAVSGRNDGQAILQALRNGAREFLTAPVQLEELMTAFKRLQRPVGAPNSDSTAPFVKTKTETSVIAVLGSSGGVGCTSLAVNLGATLAQDPSYSVALIDLDLALGDCDVALDLMGDYTLADVALNIERLDMAFLKRSLCKHASGLSLLPHPVQVEDCQLIREEHVQRLINLLRASYSHLILDLSKSFSPTDVTGLRMADTVLLVAQLELASLRNVVRMMLTLGADETIGPKVKVVLNRVGVETEITVKKAEEIIGKPIYWQVPNDVRSLQEARNNGVPLVQNAPKSKAQQTIQGLVNALAGKDAQAGQKARRWFWQTNS
jgi:pilus assembly protein CpaE